MKLEGQEITPKEYAAPAGRAVKTFFRRLFKGIVWGLGGLIVLFVLWRNIPAMFFTVTSHKLVVLDIGQGGFNVPSQETYWSNGWSIHHVKGIDFPGIIIYSVRKHNPADVQAFADAVGRITQAQIDATPCNGGTLDAPDVTYTAVKTKNTFTLLGSNSSCYDQVMAPVDNAYAKVY